MSALAARDSTINHTSDAESDDDASTGKYSRREFIGFVKSFPVLYDVTKELYRDKARKEEAWQAIATACALSANECKCKWKNIRDSFVKYINAQREGNGMTPGKKRRRAYKYSEHLQFMRPFIFTRGDAGFTAMPTASSTEYERISMVPIEEKTPDVKPNFSPRTFEPIMINVKRDDNGTSVVRSDQSPPEHDRSSLWFVKDHILPSQHSQKKNHTTAVPGTELTTLASEITPNYSSPDEEDRLFCLSLVPTLRRFDLKTRQAAKIRLQTLLYEMEFETTSP